MLNFYKREIEKVAMEKIAARAWKKFLPRLSDANYNKLLESGVYNPDRELKGLRRGTHAILAKHNAKMVRNPSQATATNIELARGYNKSRANYDLTDKDVGFLKDSMKNNDAYSASRVIMPSTKGTKEPVKGVNGKTGMSFVPKNEYNRMFSNSPIYKQNGLTPISRRDRESRKWTQAITERHEADEIRYSNNLSRKGRDKDLDNQYYSHFSPKVLAQESANVGLMPRSIKDNKYKGLRNLPKNVATEAESIGSLTGTPYGSSAVYDKKGANKAEKHWFNQGTYLKPTINLKKENL